MKPKMRTDGRLAVISTVLLLVVTQSHYAEASSDGCPNTANCMCYYDGNYDVNCNNGAYSLYIMAQGYAYLQCNPMIRSSNYSVLPALSPSITVRSFSIRGCSLPDFPFADLIERLTSGRHQLEQLSFQNSGKNVTTALERRHLRGLEKIYRLVLSGSAISSLPEDLFEDMANLTWLNLRANEIRLHPDVFRPITKLTNLELGSNELRTLPEGLFRHSQALKHLNLWKNNLQNLTSADFDGLDSLTDLDLSENSLQYLDPEIFYNLTSLKVLNLGFNNFTALPRDLLSRNEKLESFRLIRNYGVIRRMPSGLLSNLTSLTSVQLDECGIEILEEGVFWGSTKIQNMSLNRNALVSIPGKVFRDQKELWNLDLSFNKISHIADDAFQSLTNMKALNLNHNSLKTIPGKLFLSCTSLNSLKARHNKLRSIDKGAFATTKNLEFVDMSYNNLYLMEDKPMSESDEFIPFAAGPHSPFDSITELKHLNLSHNNIDTVFQDWTTVHFKLLNLDLSYNNLSKIQFQDVHFSSNDITVDLRHNFITELDFNVAEQVALANANPQPDAYHGHTADPVNRKIYIGDNPFNCNCSLYHFVRYLRGEIDPQVQSLVNVIAEGAVCHTPAPFKDRPLKSLETCDMLCDFDSSQTQKKACPKNCHCFIRLCDRTQLIKCSPQDMELPLRLPQHSYLKHIELHFEDGGLNDISSLGMNRGTFDDIKKLFVSGNNITKLTVDDIPKNISVLDLRNNSISYVDPKVVEKLTNASLTSMYISGNPVVCDCKNQPFLSFLQNKYTMIYDLKKLKCSNKNEYVQTVSVGNLCGSSNEIIASSIALAIFGFLFGIAATLYYRYQMEVKVWLFSKGWLLWWITEEEVDRDKIYDAFVSWSHKDDDFVINKLLPELEGGPHPFKICVHYRDWVVGEMITTQITRTITDSRRTIVVLSPNFLESVWGILEFKIAHCRALEEGRTRVIVIRYGDIGPIEKLDKELQAYLSTNTYLEWGDPRFWQKLRYALPHPTVNRQLNMTNGIIKRKDDKLELIHPSSPSSTPPGQNTPPAHQAHSNPLMEHVSSFPNGNGMKPGHLVNGSITLNGRKINGNAKHSDV